LRQKTNPLQKTSEKQSNKIIQPTSTPCKIECQALWQLNMRPLEDQNISNENMQISIAVPVIAVN